MIVGVRLILDQDLAHHADTHLTRNVPERQRVEGLHDLPDERRIRQVALADEPFRRLGMTMMLERFAHDRVPCLVQLVGAAGRHLVRAHAVQAFHQQIADDQRLDDTMQQRRRGLEAWIVLNALRGNGDHRNLRVAGIHQRLANQTEIVGGTAHAAGLCDGQRGMVGIVPALQNRIHQLADDHDGRIAGVVVHIFETGFHILTAGMFKNVELVAAGTDDGFHQGEVNRAHLRSHDGVILHILAKRHAVRILRHGGRIMRGSA